jgi:hypothetical protein
MTSHLHEVPLMLTPGVQWLGFPQTYLSESPMWHIFIGVSRGVIGLDRPESDGWRWDLAMYQLTESEALIHTYERMDGNSSHGHDLGGKDRMHKDSI